MKKQVVLYKKLSPLLMARLHEQTDVTLIDNLDADGLAQLREALPRAHGLLGASLKLDAGLLDLAPNLRAIASVSVGVDNYDIDYLTERRILLSNTPDVLTETTADTGFALMRPETIFINISRGKVVDETALIEALRSGQIRAAGLDVFEREPLNPDSPLLQLNNVVATPHIGSATHETREAMATCAVDNLLAALAGERPKNLVNTRAWKG